MSRCMGTTLPGTPDRPPVTKDGFVARFRRKLSWFKSDRHDNGTGKSKEKVKEKVADRGSSLFSSRRRGSGRSVVPEPPRPATIQRQESERRERLRPHQPTPDERRAESLERRRLSSTAGGPRFSSRSLQPVRTHSGSLREEEEEQVQQQPGKCEEQREPEQRIHEEDVENKVNEDVSSSATEQGVNPRDSEIQVASPSESALSDTDGGDWYSRNGEQATDVEPEEEDWRWILNLSMHFRDQSDREKFFVTYAEQPNLRRRITVSCDYRNAEEGTLERELANMKYQRDKSAKIYEAIKESLPDIKFYDTITNLKLQTSEGRLHVHVTEDLHEIIPFPPVTAIAHLRCPKYRERDLEFDSHLSGFVYKVRIDGKVYIKKEIPGPDTVDEFLYEINALYALADSDNVIRFGGCVVDDSRQKVKGLLISFASKGALIDIIFHEQGKLPWKLREKWAKQIVSGLSEIHEAGYVQGDFTLSNIVIDENDDAKIIDINRRGCPVGWEPPEVTAMIDGLQRIGMYIGVKSDIFQLGMVLWGIANQMDEPETVPRPLGMQASPEDVPQYFRNIVEACLCDRPQGRPSAKEIIAMFPDVRDDEEQVVPAMSRFDGEERTGWETMNWGRPNGYVVGEVSTEGERTPGLGERQEVNGMLLSEETAQDGDSHSNSTYVPFSQSEIPLNSGKGDRSSKGTAIQSRSGLSGSNGAEPEEELEVIEACPSEISGDEPYVPTIIESVIGIPPKIDVLVNRELGGTGLVINGPPNGPAKGGEKEEVSPVSIPESSKIFEDDSVDHGDTGTLRDVPIFTHSAATSDQGSVDGTTTASEYSSAPIDASVFPLPPRSPMRVINGHCYGLDKQISEGQSSTTPPAMENGRIIESTG
ncbi:hypothetical protein RUND412_005534 [Rhizina undulata]